MVFNRDSRAYRRNAHSTNSFVDLPFPFLQRTRAQFRIVPPD